MQATLSEFLSATRYHLNRRLTVVQHTDKIEAVRIQGRIDQIDDTLAYMGIFETVPTGMDKLDS